LVGQLLEGVVPEEAQRMREDGQRLDRLTVAGRQFRVGVEVLTKNKRKRTTEMHSTQDLSF